MGAKLDKILRRVWGNNPPCRYLPRAYSLAGPGWGVWDVREGRFVEGKDVLKIDPGEVFAN